MTKYQVLDNGKPAEIHTDARLGWTNSVFENAYDAKVYADKWLGCWSPGIANLRVNEKFDYDGYGDIIEIKEISELAP